MSAPRRIVSNTGPLISLEKLSNGYELMRRLYVTILIPRVVLEEVAADQFSTPTAYLQHYGIADLLEVHSDISRSALPALKRLHEGERQAICLALERRLPLLIEETIGREIASQFREPVIAISCAVLADVKRRLAADRANRRC